jgi:hypothetical protein
MRRIRGRGRFEEGRRKRSWFRCGGELERNTRCGFVWILDVAEGNMLGTKG